MKLFSLVSVIFALGCSNGDNNTIAPRNLNAFLGLLYPGQVFRTVCQPQSFLSPTIFTPCTVVMISPNGAASITTPISVMCRFDSFVGSGGCFVRSTR